MKMKQLDPPKMGAPFGRYAHGVEISQITRIVQSSGQLAIDNDGQIPLTAYDQANMIFSNLGMILQEAKMSVHNIVHIKAYVTDRDHMPDYMKARDAFLKETKTLPASTLLIVSGFTKPEFKVEIELTAFA